MKREPYMFAPCNPCVCPAASCEQCMFGYKTPAEHHKMMKDLIVKTLAGEKPLGWAVAERYMQYHPDYKDILNAEVKEKDMMDLDGLFARFEEFAKEHGMTCLIEANASRGSYVRFELGGKALTYLITKHAIYNDSYDKIFDELIAKVRQNFGLTYGKVEKSEPEELPIAGLQELVSEPVSLVPGLTKNEYIALELTKAYCARTGLSKYEVVEVYRKFIEMLEEEYEENGPSEER